MKKTTIRRVGIAVLALLGSQVIASCGTDDAASDSTATSVEDVTVEGAWARTSAAMADMGAAYMKITSPVDDSLVDVKVDASVAAMAQIHEVVMSGDDMTMDSAVMAPDSTAAPQMTMQEVDEIKLPAGTTVELKPGGYHIMLMKLAAPLESGSSINVTLVFGKSGEKVVSVPVRDDAP